MADVFDNQVPEQWRAELWELIRQTPALDWMLLTKRPQNIAKMLPADWGRGWPNVWLGTTTENQTEADRRIPHLRAVPAVIRFLSCEPLLSQVRPDLARIHWVISGGESGPQHRPMQPEWARSLRDQCAAAGVEFFHKQNGGVTSKAGGKLLYGRLHCEFPQRLRSGPT
jgi:protein gp37